MAYERVILSTLSVNLFETLRPQHTAPHAMPDAHAH